MDTKTKVIWITVFAYVAGVAFDIYAYSKINQSSPLDEARKSDPWLWPVRVAQGIHGVAKGTHQLNNRVFSREGL